MGFELQKETTQLRHRSELLVDCRCASVALFSLAAPSYVFALRVW